jgi:hypothetical protein
MDPIQQTTGLTPRMLLVTPHTKMSPRRRHQLSQHQPSQFKLK